jgi:hypothetical protein
MAAHSNQDAGHFQSMNDDQLIGVGAVTVFLREAMIEGVWDGVSTTNLVVKQTDVIA